MPVEVTRLVVVAVVTRVVVVVALVVVAVVVVVGLGPDTAKADCKMGM